MDALILAGGKGTRLAPYTTVFPKPLLPIGDKPILDLIIKQLYFFGFRKIVLSVGYLSELIRTYFYNNNDMPEDLELLYIKENKPLGTAGPLSLLPKMNKAFLVLNGDTLTTLDYRALVDFHQSHDAILTIASYKRQVKIDFGVIYKDNEDRLLKYDEKPALDYLVSMGVYVFDPEVLRYIDSDQRCDFPDLVKTLLSKNKKVKIYSFDDYWLDIGRHDDYEDAVNNFESMKDKLLKSS